MTEHTLCRKQQQQQKKNSVTYRANPGKEKNATVEIDSS